jgi:hypothetical protein
MKVNGVTGALSASMLAVLALAVGCTEDVGECFSSPTDMREGLDTVVVGGHVEYGGQAIMNRACASGCHQSTVTGEGRHGAPAGLDFDLNPVEATATTESAENDKGRTYSVLEPDAVNGLRERQRKVFTERNRIWQQVKDGLMPPDGKFEIFKKAVTSIFDSEEASPCTRGEAFKDLDAKSTQDVLRNWLACQAPIVESYGGPVEANGVAGKAGYQYLACEEGTTPEGDAGVGDAGSGGTVITIEQVWDDILDPALCSACHPAVDDSVDLTTADKAYEALVLDTAIKCAKNNKPYVTPGDPSKSFIYEIVSSDTPACSQRMPQGGTLTAAQLKKISDWITQGAKREADVNKSLPMSGGLDGGMN